MRLKELRKQNKKTQQEIAEYLNLTQVSYGRYELNLAEPTIETLTKLADYYSVSVDYLIGRDGNEFSYLSPEEKTLIVNFRKISTYNQAKLIGEISGIILAQD